VPVNHIFANSAKSTAKLRSVNNKISNYNSNTTENYVLITLAKNLLNFSAVT